MRAASDLIAVSFQLTPPMWVATRDKSKVTAPADISTHATHKGGDFRKFDSQKPSCSISTHTTHVGGDLKLTSMEISPMLISTHTTHVGGD